MFSSLSSHEYTPGTPGRITEPEALPGVPQTTGKTTAAIETAIAGSIGRNRLFKDSITFLRFRPSESPKAYEQWPNLPFEGKRNIAETITEQIVIDKQGISIGLSCLPRPLRKSGEIKECKVSALAPDPAIVLQGLSAITAKARNDHGLNGGVNKIIELLL